MLTRGIKRGPDKREYYCRNLRLFSLPPFVERHMFDKYGDVLKFNEVRRVLFFFEISLPLFKRGNSTSSQQRNEVKIRNFTINFVLVTFLSKIIISKRRDNLISSNTLYNGENIEQNKRTVNDELKKNLGKFRNRVTF